MVTQILGKKFFSSFSVKDQGKQLLTTSWRVEGLLAIHLKANVQPFKFPAFPEHDSYGTEAYS